MYSIGCTVKLLKRAGFTPEPVIQEPFPALGNWHANLLYFSRNQLILFVNDRSRLAVVTPARESGKMGSHLTTYLDNLLRVLDMPSKWIDAEIGNMAAVHYAKTHSRSILGTMIDYKWQIETYTRFDKDELLEMCLRLSECPIGPMDYDNPRNVTFNLLKSRYDALS